ncbi:endonuclease/exonuclease/phosphatase family protein [Nonomuraea sp. CA-143628]|uniref:endonuclease/exonuclease/phosphatase family protein n=1 Tax=Nonomuraea sp. CA-143628 TaxID=3239997 RepID=UPI003D92C00E
MPDDLIQGALFGSLDDEPAAPAPAPGELRVCALNINNPRVPRAQQTLSWLLASRSNVLVLTELKPSDGAKLIISGLAAEGFEVCLPPGWAGGSYFTVVATRGMPQTPVDGPGDPRAVAVDVEHDDKQIRIIGLYGPTNGMTTDSSDRRRAFQKTFLEYLHAIHRPKLLLAGDINVVEPGHQPPLTSFEEHDYAFYTGLQRLGLADAFRQAHPAVHEHSWISDRYGAQRLDHLFATPATGTLVNCAYDHTPRTSHITDHAALRATFILDAPA